MQTEKLICAGILLGSLVSPLLADETFDWLEQQRPATRPTTQPTTAPNPLSRNDAQHPALEGKITLSDGTMLSGTIQTTPGKPLRFWVEQEHNYRDVPLEEIAQLKATVLWERIEKEWHFIASGSDVKEYTGRTYPARETAYTAKLKSGEQITGGIVAPLYVTVGGEEHTLLLNKRAKGEFGQSLPELVYVKELELRPARR